MLLKARPAGPSPNKLSPDWDSGEGNTFQRARRQHTRLSDACIAAAAAVPTASASKGSEEVGIGGGLQAQPGSCGSPDEVGCGSPARPCRQAPLAEQDTAELGWGCRCQAEPPPQPAPAPHLEAARSPTGAEQEEPPV